MSKLLYAIVAELILLSQADAAVMVHYENVTPGVPSYYYDMFSGEFWADGEGVGIGLIDAQSASGIFSDRTVPGGLFPVDTDTRMSVVINAGTGSTLPNVRLANIGVGLTPEFLTADLTLVWSAGFGNPSQVADLIIYYPPEPATASLAGLAIAGVLGFRRRR